MQPAQSGHEATKPSSMKRYGPIIGIVAAVGIGVGAVALTGGDDKKAVSSATEVSAAQSPAANSSAPTNPAPANSLPLSSNAGTTPATDTVPTTPAPVTYPLSFSQAKKAGTKVDFGARCDSETGRVAVPDFFAAECYAPFTGDNGGATAQGVTADEINVVYYIGIAQDPIISYVTDAIKNDDTNAQYEETMRNVVQYFESYYETYGRKVKLTVVEGTGYATDEVAARADAVHIAEDIKPFMVWGGPALTNAFADELAAHDIMCISCTPAQPPQWYVERDPNVWGIDGGAEQKQVHVLEYVKKQLIGKKATHAGPDFVDKDRTFGYLNLETSATSKELADSFAAGMSDAGAPLAEVVSYALDPATIQQSASQAIAKFKAAGVTTVIFNGDPVAPREFTKEATAQGYSPEWVIAAATLTDLNAFARTYDQAQWQHAFGVSTLSARLLPDVSGYYRLYKWFTGVEAPANDSVGVIAPSPAVFYAALQGVGPNLTHETWKNSLFALAASVRAVSAPSLSWGDKGIWPQPDYLGIDDATAIWWDPTATGPDEIRRDGTGMYQFVDGGKRFLPGEWGTDDKMFNPDGAVTLYTTAPPGEEVKDYPSPAG